MLIFNERKENEVKRGAQVLHKFRNRIFTIQ